VSGSYDPIRTKELRSDSYQGIASAMPLLPQPRCAFRRCPGVADEERVAKKRYVRMMEKEPGKN